MKQNCEKLCAELSVTFSAADKTNAFRMAADARRTNVILVKVDFFITKKIHKDIVSIL